MWDERYQTDEFIFGTEPNEFLKANAGKLKPGSVLCLADGEVNESLIFHLDFV